jgi:kinesin family protein 3/17
VFIKDLNMMVCKNIQEMDNYMAIGNKSRSTGATLMNADSSRSHSIFTCYIECS